MDRSDERDFDALYLAWLMCGMDTYVLDEAWERHLRQIERQKKAASICMHGRVRNTCDLCYVRDTYGPR